MRSTSETKWDGFLKQFDDLSKRAKQNWPLSGKSRKTEPDRGMGYVFTIVSLDSPSSVNNNLVKSFEHDLCRDKHLFSGQSQTAASIWTRPVPAHDTNEGHCRTFLIIGHARDEHVARMGCTVQYFTRSKCILIESIWVHSSTEHLKNGIKELEEPLSENCDAGDGKCVKTVLRWMLTYPFVGKQDNQSGLKKLIDSELNNKIDGIFHPAGNPSFDEGPQRKRSVKALEYLHAINAAYLKFKYRPAHFKPGEEARRDSLLLTFPQFIAGSDGLQIEASRVMKFLIDHAKFLYPEYQNYEKDIATALNSSSWNAPLLGFGKIAPEADPVRANQAALLGSIGEPNQSQGLLYLHRVPRAEVPRLKFRRASVGFEIVVDEDYFRPENMPEEHIVHSPGEKLTGFGKFVQVIRKEWRSLRDPIPDPLYCDVSHSGETDLFAYKYQDNPPYYTVHFRSTDIKITFPSSFEFTSEGRAENFYRLPNAKEQSLIEKSTDVFPKFEYTVNMTASVSYTYFRKSAVRVWHLVLRPIENGHVSEMDLIKLMRFFSGSQEFESEKDRMRAMEAIKFEATAPLESKSAEKSLFGSRIFHKFNNLSEFLFENRFRLDHGYARWERVFQFLTWSIKVWLPGILTLIILFSWKGEYNSNFATIATLPLAWHVPAMIIYWLIASFAVLSTISWTSTVLKKSIKLGKRTWNWWMDKLMYQKTLADDKGEDVALMKLLSHLTGVSYQNRDNGSLNTQHNMYKRLSLENVTSGVVEIDTGSLLSDTGDNNFEDQNFLGFYPAEPPMDRITLNKIREKIKDMYKELCEGNISVDDSDNPRIDEYAEYVFKAYCGICLGIFDFDRMGFQEIDDTLVPLPDSKTESSFLAIHRGVLAMIGSDDDVMNTFLDSIGINLYLLIPSALLAHNDKVARDAESRLDELLRDLRSGRSELTIRELNEQRNEVDDLLNDNILGNVFQYKTEQELYRHGMERRGIDERIKDSKAKLEQLEKLIQIKLDESTSRYQRRITIAATLVGIVSFYDVIHNYFVNELAEGGEAESEKYIPIEKVNDQFQGMIAWLDDNIPFMDFCPDKGYDPLALAHFSIGVLFVGLVGFLMISTLVHPERNKRFFWQKSINRFRTTSRPRKDLDKHQK